VTRRAGDAVWPPVSLVILSVSLAGPAPSDDPDLADLWRPGGARTAPALGAAARAAAWLARERELVERLTAAFESADVDAIVAMMTEDAWLTMPPLPLEYQGRELAVGFLTATAFRPAGPPDSSRPGRTASPRSASTPATRTRGAITRSG